MDGATELWRDELDVDCGMCGEVRVEPFLVKCAVLKDVQRRNVLIAVPVG